MYQSLEVHSIYICTNEKFGPVFLNVTDLEDAFREMNCAYTEIRAFY